MRRGRRGICSVAMASFYGGVSLFSAYFGIRKYHYKVQAFLHESPIGRMPMSKKDLFILSNGSPFTASFFCFISALDKMSPASISAVWNWLCILFLVQCSGSWLPSEASAAATDERLPRRVDSVRNPFEIVHDWKTTYDDAEEDFELTLMEPTSHVLYGQTVPIDVTPPGISTYIVGGEPVDGEATPASWMVVLLTWNQVAGRWQFSGCSGTLIASRYVLTAAHCVEDRLSAPDGWDAVLVQAYKPFERGNGGFDRHFSFVESISIHPNFTTSRFDKDVALIRLSQAADTTLFPVLQLAVPDFPIASGEVVTVYGFGRTSEEEEDLSDVLREVDVPFVPAPLCRQYYGFQVTDDMVCAGLQEGGKDACNGDSGGPLTREVEGTAYQVGIVSWGDGCARANAPGVYTSVSFYYPWIADGVCTDADMQVELADSLCRVDSGAPSMTPSWPPTSLSTTLPPTSFPTPRPTSFPTPAVVPLLDEPSPTEPPSPLPTTSPTSKPSRAPFKSPTRSPSLRPTRQPSASPVLSPTSSPSESNACLALDSPCIPWEVPVCCSGTCLEWWGADNEEIFLCTLLEDNEAGEDEGTSEDSGKKGKSKKKKKKSEDRRGL